MDWNKAKELAKTGAQKTVNGWGKCASWVGGSLKLTAWIICAIAVIFLIRAYFCDDFDVVTLFVKGLVLEIAGIGLLILAKLKEIEARLK